MSLPIPGSLPVSGLPLIPAGSRPLPGSRPAPLPRLVPMSVPDGPTPPPSPGRQCITYSFRHHRAPLPNHPARVRQMTGWILQHNRLPEARLPQGDGAGLDLHGPMLDLHGHLLSTQNLRNFLYIVLQYDATRPNDMTRTQLRQVHIHSQRNTAQRSHVTLLNGKITPIDRVTHTAAALTDQHRPISLDGKPDRHTTYRTPTLDPHTSAGCQRVPVNGIVRHDNTGE